MHIPSSMMEGAVCPVTVALATAGIAAAVVAARRSEEKPSPARFAAVSALIFAGQMLNFPVQDGTSGHLMGGVLAALLLGLPFGVLAMALVVAVQAALFADGGLNVLGANVLNMAVIGAGLAGSLAVAIRRRFTGWQRFAGTAAVAWLSVVLAALACAIELAASGTIALAQVVPAMLGTHALIGIGEAAITVALLAVVAERERSAYDFRAILLPFGLALFAAVVLSRFASPFPDGLEWVATELSFLSESTGAVFAPFADYRMPGVSHNAASTGLAGLAGVMAIALAAALSSRLWHRPAVAGR